MKTYAKYLFAMVLIIVAVMARWIPHAPNFTPVLAVLIFSTWAFKNRILGMAIPLMVLVISDSVLGFYQFSWAIYLCYGLVFFASLQMFHISKNKWLVRGASFFTGSVVFFLSSNIAVWAFGGMYPKNLTGMFASLVAGLPFFHNTLISTFVFGTALVVVYDYFLKRIFQTSLVFNENNSK